MSAFPQPAPAPSAYPQPAPAYPQPAPAYPQPAPGYPQPAPGYPQPAPAYVAQPAVASPELLDMMGYVKTVYVFALLELIALCCTIVGLVFIYMPICGMRTKKRWDFSDMHCYYIWKLIEIVLSAISFGYSLIGAHSMGSVVSLIVNFLISFWAFWVAYKAHKGWESFRQYTPQDLINIYNTNRVDCKVF